MIKFMDLHKQYLSIKDDIDEAIASVIQSTAFIGGKYVKQFEQNFAVFQQAEYCVGVGNGTDALEIALEALGLPAGSEVIVPANSFIASSEAVTRAGLKVAFCDVDPRTYTLDLVDLEARITDKTSAIMAVHLYGHPCEMEEILALAKVHDLKVIEDSAQAHGAEFDGKRVGAIGDIGTFSFYPGKNLGAYGDGGAIVTNNESLAIKCRMIANHGRVEKYNHEFEGRNSRLDGLQAAILDVKLSHLDSWTDQRNVVAKWYQEELRECSAIVLPISTGNKRHAYHLFVIQTGERDKLAKLLLERGVQTGVHYPISLPKLQAYEYLKMSDAKLDANILDSTLLSLPIGEHLKESDVKYICLQLKEALAELEL